MWPFKRRKPIQRTLDEGFEELVAQIESLQEEARQAIEARQYRLLEESLYAAVVTGEPQFVGHYTGEPVFFVSAQYLKALEDRAHGNTGAEDPAG